MSQRWFSPSNNADWVSKSADGYYGVKQGEADVAFAAYYIPALWAREEWIGGAVDIIHAQEICEQHRARAA